METSSEKDFSVYEFGGAEEVVESASMNKARKFMSTNPTSEKSSLSKYHFLEVFAQGQSVKQTEIKDVGCVDLDASYGDGKCCTPIPYAVGSPKGDFSLQEETSGSGDILLSTSMINDEHCHTSRDELESRNLTPRCLSTNSLGMERLSLGVPSVENKPLCFTLPELQSDRKQVDLSDDEANLEASSLSTSDSDCVENEGSIEDPTSDHCFAAYSEMEMRGDMEVAISPDYVMFGDKFFAQSQLIFFPQCIKLEDSNACEFNTPVSYEWAVDDVAHIGCHWNETVEMASVTLLLRSETVVGAENMHVNPGVVKLVFAVDGPQWLEKQQKITLLTARYKALLNVSLDSEQARGVDSFKGQDSIIFLKHYFTNLDEPSEEVVYPKGDPDAVSISKRDVKLLDPETFINDTIIDFYIKYLKNKIQPEDKNRFHFFNSFFFRKLADLDKHPGSALEGRAAFQRVRKWTRKVNIFEKDYIFVPVNYNLHWSLIVICHPGEVALFEDEEIDKAPKVPCLLHMDSIKGSHQGLKNLVQSYLWEEWKERHRESSEDVQLKFKSLRFVHLELPQQENSFDCGLFLLHYVERFLEEAPANFSPFKITKFSNFLNFDWFPPSEASHKRFALRKLICELFDDHSHGVPPANCGNGSLSSKYPEDETDTEQVIEFLSNQCTTAKKTSNLLGSQMQSLPTPSPSTVQYDKETGILLRPFFEQGAVAVSYSEGRYQHFNQISTFQDPSCTLSPIQEDAETSEQFVSSPSDKTCYQLPDGVTAEACTPSYSNDDAADVEEPWSLGISMPPEEQTNEDSRSESLGCQSPKSPNAEVDKPWLPEISMHPKEQTSEDSQSESLSCQSLKSTDAGVDEHPPSPIQSRDFLLSIEEREAVDLRLESPRTCGAVASASSEKPETCIVADSQENKSQVDAAGETKEGRDSFFSFQESFPASSHQDNPQHVDATENEDRLGDEAQLAGVVSETRSKQPPPKRRKIIPSEIERRRTRRSEKECHP